MLMGKGECKVAEENEKIKRVRKKEGCKVRRWCAEERESKREGLDCEWGEEIESRQGRRR